MTASPCSTCKADLGRGSGRSSEGGPSCFKPTKILTDLICATHRLLAPFQGLCNNSRHEMQRIHGAHAGLRSLPQCSLPARRKHGPRRDSPNNTPTPDSNSAKLIPRLARVHHSAAFSTRGSLPAAVKVSSTIAGRNRSALVSFPGCSCLRIPSAVVVSVTLPSHDLTLSDLISRNHSTRLCCSRKNAQSLSNKTLVKKVLPSTIGRLPLTKAGRMQSAPLTIHIPGLGRLA